MPYQGEFANKASHFDIIKNPEVAAFLNDCNYLTAPSEEEGRALGAYYTEPPAPANDQSLPEHIIAVDGSYYESSIEDHLPSTRLGYVKISTVLINMTQFDTLKDGRFVDPFRVAALRNNNDALTFSLPSANIRWKGKPSVRDSFRAMVDASLYGVKTRFNPGDAQTSLRSTLFHLASRRPGDMGTKDPKCLKIYSCPTCKSNKEPIEIYDVPDAQFCPACGEEVYPSDCLRLWEEVSEHQSNVTALSRFMLLVEHMLPVHYIRYLFERSLDTLCGLAFFVDGPLAVFGTGAWMHYSIMRILTEINDRLWQTGRPGIIIIGLQKTGQVVDHAALIDRYIQPGNLFAIDDEYRYRHILSGREVAGNGFGSETYYGQDFIYKTPSGKCFIFGLPYPFATKNPSGIDFMHAKTERDRYRELPIALSLIRHFESDLYRNAIIPIALAHRYTSISLVPGGRVLDLLTREALLGRR